MKNPKRWWAIILLVMTACFIAVTAENAFAAYFYVDSADPACSNVNSPDGHTFCSIQPAIATVPPGSQILVKTGTYDGFVVNKSNLTIKADAGATPVIFGAQVVVLPATTQAYSSIFIAASNVTIEGLTILGDNATGPPPVGPGDVGIWIAGGNTPATFQTVNYTAASEVENIHIIKNKIYAFRPKNPANSDRGYGIFVFGSNSSYGNGNTQDVYIGGTIQNKNIIRNNNRGIGVLGDVPRLQATYNDLSGNSVSGLSNALGHFAASPAGIEIDARRNWWGAGDGPSGGVPDSRLTSVHANGSGGLIFTWNPGDPSDERLWFYPYSLNDNLTQFATTGLDNDTDGIDDADDNCPYVANDNQTDSDSDGIGDACDVCPHDPANDWDGDGICGNVDNCPNIANPGQVDNDSDGFGAACDCNDNNSAIHPGATEGCNYIDDNCNGVTDEGVNRTIFPDYDGDGFFQSGVSCGSCHLVITGFCGATPPGYADHGGDCDDDNASIYPGATETCNGIDDDCDGVSDNIYTFYRDADNDTYGDPDDYTGSCDNATPPAGYVANSSDCDDGNAMIHPGAAEACNGRDNNCDGFINNVYTFYWDDDGDGYGNPDESLGSCDNEPQPGYVDNSTDCDDTNSAIHPGATDADCNNKDNDCNGFTDDGYVPGPTSCGEGACAATGTSSCVAGVVQQNCTAGIPTTEVCNGIDDDCDGEIDNGLVFHFYYRDADNDTYGDADNATVTCDGPPEGYVDNQTADNTTAFDCQDNDSDVHPGAADAICNGIDNNCDNSTDEGYVDNNTCGVGYCQTSNTPSSCVDGDETACQPGSPSGIAESVCNGDDDDCDGETDEDYVDNTSCFKVGVCAGGNVASTCIDGDETACQTGSPSGIAESICNGADDDCDGETDEDYEPVTSCFKVGVCAGGNVASTCIDGDETACQTGSPSGIAESVCNGEDDDCDGQTDEAFVGTQTFCGVGACVRTGITTCSGGITGDTCTPGTPAARDAVCDGRDADCDGTTDEDYVADSSCGVGACKTNNTASSCIGGVVTACQPGPSTDEVCNGIDDDCDGVIDNGLVTHTYYRDADNDTYGDADNATVACAAPEGYVDSLMADNTTIAFDCNDNDPTLTDNCTVCTDSDGDGYGENCAAGPDCDDSDASIHTGCTETPCILKVVPKQIFKLLAFLNPFIPFVISAESDSGVIFARPFEIDWGTEAINDILRIKVGKRIIVGFLFARPLQLESDNYTVVVTYGDNETEECGKIEIK